MELIVRILRAGIISAIIIFPLQLLGQNPSLSPDGLGFYWVVQGNNVKRIDSEGKTIASYSNVMLGNPTSVDPTDPFRVVIFYSQTQQIILINNDAVKIGNSVYLPDLGVGEIAFVSRSSRGGVWLYSKETNEILLTNRHFTSIVQRIVLQHHNLSTLPNTLTEKNGVLYLGSDNKHIECFDLYGAKLSSHQMPTYETFRVYAGVFWILRDGRIEKREINNPEIVLEIFKCPCISLPAEIKGKPMCFDGNSFIACEKILN